MQTFGGLILLYAQFFRYRHLLRQKEQHVATIEAKFRKVSKACNEMVQRSEKYSESVVRKTKYNSIDTHTVWFDMFVWVLAIVRYHMLLCFLF